MDEEQADGDGMAREKRMTIDIFQSASKAFGILGKPEM